MDKRSKKILYFYNNEILSTYYVIQNLLGEVSHFFNCSYIVSAEGGGKVLCTLICEHLQKISPKNELQSYVDRCDDSHQHTSCQFIEKTKL